MLHKRILSIAVLCLLAFCAMAAQDQADLAALYRIKDEGLQRSQVMEIASYLTDVYGPRLAGSGAIRKAADWVQTRLKDWGLQNVHVEKYDFGRSWELKKFSAHMVEPVYSPLIAYPKAWTPGTGGPVRGEAVRVEINSESDFEQYRGKLKGLFVLRQPPRDLQANFTPQAERYTDEQLAGIARMPDPAGRQNRYRQGGMPSRELTRKTMAFFVSEGVAAVIDGANGDGGSVFVAAGGERSRDAQPVAPQVSLAAEHYNRICRILDKKIKVRLEIEVDANYLTDNFDDINVVAEFPGTDRKDEIVMLGGHLDSWHAATGATDDAAGCAVAMEAVRILKATGLQSRRTVRLALWGGEEEGLLGSRAYVSEHFASRPSSARGQGNNQDDDRRPAPAPPIIKPDHGRLSAYFNLDNGTGKIRGIYLQGNEEVRPIFEAWLAPFRDMGATTVSIRNTGGTDHLSFDAVGLPGFQFIQDDLDYDTRTHHSNMDLYDRIQRGDMVQAAVIMASFVYHTAMRDQMLPRKPLPKPRPDRPAM